MNNTHLFSLLSPLLGIVKYVLLGIPGWLGHWTFSDENETVPKKPEYPGLYVTEIIPVRSSFIYTLQIDLSMDCAPGSGAQFPLDPCYSYSLNLALNLCSLCSFEF